MRCVVVWNNVDFDVESTAKIDQLQRILDGIVQAFDQCDLNPKSIVLQSVDFGDGLSEHVQVPYGFWNQPTPLVRICRMEAQCDSKPRESPRHLDHLGWNSCGRQSDRTQREPKPTRVAEDADGLLDSIGIVQGFTHPHEDNIPQGWRSFRIAYPIPSNPAGPEKLLDDLEGGKVSLKAHFASGAESASHRAADLGR